MHPAANCKLFALRVAEQLVKVEVATHQSGGVEGAQQHWLFVRADQLISAAAMLLLLLHLALQFVKVLCE